MIDIAAVDAFQHELPWITESSHDIHSLFIDAIGHEVLCQRTIVAICNFLIRVGLWVLGGRTTPIV